MNLKEELMAEDAPVGFGMMAFLIVGGLGYGIVNGLYAAFGTVIGLTVLQHRLRVSEGGS